MRGTGMTDVYGCDVAVVGLGALGSAAAWQAARDGLRVVGFEQFGLGHERGASHDSSRILRHSYHTPTYVRLTFEAYDAWEQLAAEKIDHAGQRRSIGLRIVSRSGS